MSIQSTEDQAGARAVTGVALPRASASRWQRMTSAMLTESWLVRLCAMLLFGLYVRSIGFSPVYDDNLIPPPMTLRDVPMFFTHDIFGLDGTAHSVYYRPLAQTYAFVLGQVTGGAPAWLHLGAIFLQLAVCFLAYQFGRRLFHDERLALLTALLFGLHPSKVESVAWVGSSAVEGVGGVFFFASLIMFLMWRENSSGWRLAASVTLFACAMFTKETMVFVPVLIAGYLWLTLPATGRIVRTIRTVLPYGVVWIIYMAIRHEVIKPPPASADYIHPTYSLANVWTAPYAIWWYLRHLIMPWGLSVEYTSQVFTSPTLLGFVLPGAAIILLLATGVWLCIRFRSTVAAFLLFWFVLTLAPPVILAPMVFEHDRYLYIPAYAFCALIAWATMSLDKVWAKAPLIAALCIVILWSGLTWHEMGYWDCDRALWTRSLEISPSQLRARLQVAGLYAADGDVSKALGLLDEGLRYYPSSPRIWLDRAAILNGNKQFDEARAAYLKIIELTEPVGGLAAETINAKRARAIAAFHLAKMDQGANNLVEAERYARMALSLNSEGEGYHNVLAGILSAQGRTEEAKAEGEVELRMHIAQQLRSPWGAQR